MAAPECEREARKRRERRDSGCAHERKERRPHSEERAPPPPPTPPLHDYNRLESERRAERLSRARRPQLGGKRRRASARQPKQPKENDCSATDVWEERCPTPPHFDYASLQKPQLCEEPERLDAGALLGEAAARAAAAERARRDERSVPPLSRRESPAPDRRLDKLSKKIAVLKKSIMKHESEYEEQHGHVISASDRITDVPLTRMYETLRRLQAEKKCIKSDPVEYALKMQAARQQKERDDKLDEALKSEKSMTEVVRDIEDWLEGCRNAAGRTTATEGSWTSAQLAAEKSCVQRALLRLEAARGRPPAHSAERGAARHLYERYRAVKRALSTFRSDAIIGGTNGELATILEHEAMLFNSVDSSSDSQDKPSDSSQDTSETPLQSPPTREASEGASSSSARSGTTSDEAPNEGLHCLGLDDLVHALHEAKLHKCVLRRSIKEYELSFELQNSRKVQRDDKKGREDEYLRYKAMKARIKLLNALINKQKALNKN